MTEPPVPDTTSELAPASESAPPPPPPPLPTLPIAPGFELPGARQVVGRGLQLAYDSSRDLRRASLYVGLLMAAVAGPFAVLLLVDIPRMLGLSIANPEQMTRAQATALLAFIGPLYGAGAMALLGLLTVSIDGFLIAVAILGGRAVGRPLRLREAIARARQVFWRYGAAAVVVGIISTIVTFTVLVATGSFNGNTSLGASLLASFVATIAVAPFGYIATSIVIGDVTGGAALRRSITLVRARPRLAVTVAAFAFAASALQTFGFGVAADVVSGVAMVLHPNLDLAGPGLLVAVALAVVGLMALGSLGVTVAAVTTGPQVAAFLGLTHYTAGLDRARQPETAAHVGLDPAAPLVRVALLEPVGPEPAASSGPSAAPSEATPAAPEATAAADAQPPPTQEPVLVVKPPPRRKPRLTRWLTFPMAGLIVLEAIVVVGGVAGAETAKTASSDLLVGTLDEIGGPGAATLSGGSVVVTDPFGDQAGGKWKEADLRAGEYAIVRIVPGWVLSDAFSCTGVDVACAVGGQGPGAFDDGGLLVALQVASTPLDLDASAVGEWGPLFDLPGQAASPPGDDSYALAATAIITRLRLRLSADGLQIRRLVWETGAFREEPTAARSRLVGDTLLTLIPIRVELGSLPSAWDGLATVSGSGVAESVVTRDWLRPGESGLIPFAPPPTLVFAATSNP